MPPETKVVKAAKPVLESHKQEKTRACSTQIDAHSCISNSICSICWQSHACDVVPNDKYKILY